METSLTHLQELFAAWRAASSTKRQTNASLRREAVECLNHYSYRTVSEAIGISTNSLRSWKKSFDPNQKIISDSPGFIAMNLDTGENNIDTADPTQLSLEIRLLNGITLQIHSSNVKLSAALIVALNKESQLCST